MILYCLLSALLNALASLVLGAVVISHKPRDGRTITFAAVTVMVALWSGFYFGWQYTDDEMLAVEFVRCFTAAAVLIPVLYFHFATRFAGEAHRREIVVGYVLAVPMVLLSFTGWLVQGVGPKLMFPFWPSPGPLYPFYLALFFYYLLRSWWVLYGAYRNASYIRKNQLRYMLAYTIVGFIGGATNFPLWYDLPVLPLGNILVGAYMVGVGYAVIRFRLMAFDLLAARIIAHGIIVAGLALPTPLMVALFVPLDGGRWLVAYGASFVATTTLFWLLPLARRQVDAFLEQRMLGRLLPNRKLLRNLATKVSSASDESEMTREVVTAVAEAMAVSEVSLFTRTEFEGDFVRRAWVRHPEGDVLAMFSGDALLVRALRELERGLIVDEEANARPEPGRSYFQQLRRKQGIELVIPIIGDSYFYGFITLGPRAGAALYNDIDISLLEAVGLQIGLNLRARQLERRASQTEKLISLGTLASGLAHELRNPLVSIQTFAALLKERGTDLDFQQEFSTIVQRDVSRIASIVENVAAFAESNQVQMTAVNLGEVLTAAVEIVRPEADRHAVDITLPANDGTCVTGNYSQLLQVFLNLVQNSVQAMEGRALSRLLITSEHRADVQHPLICVTLTDNGPGIEPAMLPHIFEPFTTTKSTGKREGKHGMGLGLAIVKRIVQHHHGEINVTSTPGKGTTFRVFLPPVTPPAHA